MLGLGGRCGRCGSVAKVGSVLAPSRCFSSSVLKKGKCKGLTYEQCLAQQPQYCTWLLRREQSLDSEYQGFAGFLRVRLQASEEAVLANLEISKGKMSKDKGRLLEAGWICRFTQRRN